MALSPYTETLASGARADSTTETYDIPTRGRKGLVLVTDVTAIGNGNSYVEGGAVTVPHTVTLDTNDHFTYNSVDYTIAAGTYNTLALLKNAIAAATAASATPFSTVVAVTVSGTGFKFTSVATGVNTDAFAVDASHDALVDGLGLTDSATIADTQAAGADGAYSQTVSILGVDAESGKTWTILADTAQTDVATRVQQVHPQMTAVDNDVANALLPATVRVSITHTTNNSVTRTVAIQLVS